MFTDHSHKVFSFVVILPTMRSMATTRTSSPSDLMTRLSPARMMHASLVHFFFVTCFHSLFHISITYHTAPCAKCLMSKKKQASSQTCFSGNKRRHVLVISQHDEIALFCLVFDALRGRTRSAQKLSHKNNCWNVTVGATVFLWKQVRSLILADEKMENERSSQNGNCGRQKVMMWYAASWQPCVLMK